MGEAAARLFDDHVCPDTTSLISHEGGKILGPGTPMVLIGGLPAARMGDFALCATGPADVIVGGAAQVLIGALPAARVIIDQTVHKGAILPPGAPMVQIGGPAFVLPATFDLDGPPDFQNKLVRDLYYLSTLPEGKKLLDRLAAGGQTITFKPTDDGNQERAGIFGGPTVSYNPDRIVQVQDAAGSWSSRPLVVGLAHEMVHALGNVEGTSASGTDPSVPSEPTIESEEARAIGVGQYNGTSPTENSIRKDMKLPQRANHFGRAPPAGTPPPRNPRPGG